MVIVTSPIVINEYTYKVCSVSATFRGTSQLMFHLVAAACSEVVSDSGSFLVV